MPRRCKECNQLSFPDKNGLSAKSCLHCGSLNIECDHSGSYFDKSTQSFICGECGKATNSGLTQLRDLAKSDSGLSDLLDTTTH